MKTKIFTMAALTATVLASCSKDDGAVDNSKPVAVQFASNIADVQTRATSGNTWNGGEEVRVVINDAASALSFTAANGGILTPQTTLYWDNYPATGISAYAWFPGGYTYPVNQSGGIQAADFIFAPEVTGITKDNFSSTAKQLKFVHKTAKVSVSLSAENGIDITGAAVTFYGYTTVTAIDTTGVSKDGAITGGTISTITPAPGNVALLLPRTTNTAANFIKVTTSDSNEYFYTPASLTLEAGKSYTYEITVKKTGLTVRGTITDWTDTTGGISGDATM